ncbi:MAG: phosphatidate cytidylyltransferase [Planctomycetes bacterium]|nr:phosphatidate cytidylyltransferase [Planctomycetota bacterium]
MLRIRFPIATALIAGLLALLWLDYGTRWKVGCHLAFLGILVLGLREFYQLIHAHGSFKPVQTIGIAGGVALCAGEWISYLPALRDFTIGFWGINGLILSLILFLLIAYHAPPELRPDALGNIATTLFGLLYVWFLGSYLTKIAMLEYVKAADASRDIGLSCLLLTILTAKFADIGAFLIGRQFGRHKLAPTISPNKTVEGAFGGILMSVLVALPLQVGLQIPFLDWKEILIFAIVISCLGQLGDLAESLLKRLCEAKDSGHVIPGFGGILDVIDSLLSAAPAAYFLLLLFSEPSDFHG